MTSTACLSRDHSGCLVFMGDYDHTCSCGCHRAWSAACRWDMHEDCLRVDCACGCGHVVKTEQAA